MRTANDSFPTREQRSEALSPPPIEPGVVTHSRILQLDGFRAVAFLLVLFDHLTHTPLLWAGVDLFFVLSGFLITGILLERKRLGGPYFSYFYRRRVFRILPPYLLTLIVFGFLFDWHHYKPLWLFLLAPNVQGLVPGNTDLLPLWSLAVEEQFYLVWPLVVLFCSEKTLWRLALAALVLTPLLRAVCTPLVPNFFYIYVLTPFRADLLCAGALLAMLWRRRTARLEQRVRNWSPAVFSGGLLLFVGTQAFPAFRLARNTATANSCVYLFSLITSVGLLAWVLSSKGWLRSLLQLPPLRFVGEISYTLYLVHIFLIVKLQNHFGTAPWVKLCGVLLILVYATASWFLMERPLIRFAAKPKRIASPGNPLALPAK